MKKDAPVTIVEHDQGNCVRALSLKVRNRLKGILFENLSRSESGIMTAILLGERAGVPKLIRALFVQTGTAHILAISGLHMGIVAALFLGMAKIIPGGRRWQLAVVIVMISGYAFMAGGRPSIVRAAVMTVVFLTSFIIEKEFDRLNTLCLAAVVLLLVNPLNLYDVGFQLSFCCVFAIIYAGEAMKKIGKRRGSFILQPLFLSFVIWVSVAGLVAYHFGVVTPVTVFANVIVIPLIAIVVTLGFGLLLTGVIIPAWAFMFALSLKVVLNIMVGIIFLCDKVPFSYVYFSRDVTIWHAIAYYVSLLLIISALWYYRKRTPGVRLGFNAKRLEGIDKHARV